MSLPEPRWGDKTLHVKNATKSKGADQMTKLKNNLNMLLARATFTLKLWNRKLYYQIGTIHVCFWEKLGFCDAWFWSSRFHCQGNIFAVRVFSRSVCACFVRRLRMSLYWISFQMRNQFLRPTMWNRRDALARNWGLKAMNRPFLRLGIGGLVHESHVIFAEQNPPKWRARSHPNAFWLGCSKPIRKKLTRLPSNYFSFRPNGFFRPIRPAVN